MEAGRDLFGRTGATADLQEDAQEHPELGAAIDGGGIIQFEGQRHVELAQQKHEEGRHGQGVERVFPAEHLCEQDEGGNQCGLTAAATPDSATASTLATWSFGDLQRSIDCAVTLRVIMVSQSSLCSPWVTER